MLMCPQCGSVRVVIRGAAGGSHCVSCQDCRYGWETGRWKSRYAEDDEEMRGGRGRDGSFMPVSCQIEEGADL